MKQSFVEVSGTRTRIAEWGNKNNPIVLCLHGLGSTQLSFIEVAEALKNDFYFISIDLPAHGKTAPLKKNVTYRRRLPYSFLKKYQAVVPKKGTFLLTKHILRFNLQSVTGENASR